MTHATSRAEVNELLYNVKKHHAYLFIIFLLVYEISAYIANDMIMPGMIEVINSFNASERYVSTSLTMFILGGSSLQLILGPLSDCYGRRPVMLGGVLFFLACTILITFSQTITTFIMMRFFQGMGLCFISVIGYAVFQEIFSELSAIRLNALMNNVSILAPLMGPLIGSLIILMYDWRVIFYVIAFTTALALIGIWVYMPETVGTKRADGKLMDHTPFNFSIIKSNYFSLLSNKKFMVSSFCFALASVPIIAWIGTSPVILMKAAKLDVITYGLCQMPIFLSAIFGNIAMRIMSKSVPLTTMIHLSSIGLFICLFLMSIALFIKPSYLVLIVGMSLYSFALGFLSAPLNRIALFSTIIPKGTTSAMISIILMLITAAGNQLAGYIYTTHHNAYFGLFCAITGSVYFCSYLLFKKCG